MLFAIFQAAGFSVLAGVRAWLPALLVAVLARANMGVDFENTDFAFLESALAIVLLFAFTVAVVFLERHYQTKLPTVFSYALPMTTIIIGALFSGASFAQETSAWWPGVLIGITLSGAAYAVSEKFLARVKKRLDDETRRAFPALVDGAVFLLAGAVILFPPIAAIPCLFLLWLSVSLRKQEDRPGGLRILRS